MKTKLPLLRHLPSAICLAVIGLSSVGPLLATVVVTPTAQSGPANVFSVSNDDLLQTSLGSFSTTGSFSSFGGGQIPVLYNGLFGTSGNLNNGADGQNVAPNGGVLTLSLNVSVNTLGYDLTQLSTFASWDTGRDGQEYSVSYSTVFAPETFISLAVVPQFNPGAVADTLNSHTRITLTDSTGLLATNVANLRYSFTSFENAGTAYREIDAIGSASVPEPHMWGLLALGAGAFLVRRARAHLRQKRRS